MPSVVTFSNGNTITYTYASDGRKLRTAHKIGSTTTTTDYAGNVIYENGVQKKLLTEEGYVDISVSTPVYYYYLKDHQGNNRVVVNSGGTVTETNHYYPFGGTFASGTVQPYKYNGKELDTKAGLNWYDYGARHYDAALGRFTTQDRFAKKYTSLSPYQYGANNPVRNIDVNGDSIRVYVETNNFGHAWMSIGEGDNMVIYSYGRYNGTYKGLEGINFFNNLANGDGVLLRMTDEYAKNYMLEKESDGISSYVITDLEDEKVGNILDDIFYSSKITPNNPNSKYYNNPMAHVIDNYELLDNNCTSFVSDIINKAGSNVFETTKIQPHSSFGTFTSYSVKERFIIPSSLKKYLDNVSTNKRNVYKVK